jgi:hypothetical protein
MAIILDHTSNGNIFLKGFSENLNPYPNLSIENGGILGYLNGFPIEYVAAYNNGNGYTWGNIVSAGNKYWLRIGEPNPGYPPYEGSPYWRLYTIESPTYIFEAFGGNSYLNVYLSQSSGQSPLPEIQDEDFGGFLIEQIVEENSEQLPQININFDEEPNGGNEILISGSPIDSILNLSTQLFSKQNFVSLGDVYNQNTGISQNSIVVVEQFPDNSITINPSLISSYAIKDTFTINNTGELITLSNSDIGDVAIDIINNSNYILCSNANQAYLNIDNWIHFTGFHEGILYVNGHAADGLGNIDIDSNEIYYCTNAASFSDKISETNVATTGILQNYQKCNLFLNQTGNYALTNIFNNIACAKINQYHEHDITGIINLSGRLEVLKVLCTGGNYSYLVSSEDSVSQTSNAFIFGYYGLAKNTGEIVYTPCDLYSNGTGLEQVSKLVIRGTTNSCNNCSIYNFSIPSCTLEVVKAEVVAKSKTDNSIVGSFLINSSFARESVGCSALQLNQSAIDVYSQKDNLIADFAINANSGYSLYVSGGNCSEINWLANVNIMKIRSAYGAWNGLDPE